MPDDATAGLIFASDQANHNFARVLGDLRRAHLSITHRLRSICRDAAFVTSVARRYPDLALVANERCGSWYMPAVSSSTADATPAVAKRGSAYFKSTDGHTGQWSFSMRRLNLHLLPLICGVDADAGSNANVNTNADANSNVGIRGGGIILVDSTRRGKRMPDALSKTVPLWCCVLNRALLGDDADGDDADTRALYTPPGVVSASEHSQMLARVPDFVAGLRRLGVLSPDTAAWRFRHLPNGLPLRPVWITPDMPWPDIESLRDRFNVVLCCTSSHVPSADDDDIRTVRGSASSRNAGTHDSPDSAASVSVSSGYSPDYVQGAADDTENWAHGLTPELFWAYFEQLLETPEADLPALIASLVQGSRNGSNGLAGSAEGPDSVTSISISPYLAAGQWTGPTPPAAPPSVCQISFVRQNIDPTAWARSPTTLEVGLGKQDKIAGRTLRYALPQICAFVATYLDRAATEATTPSVRVLCPTGRDLAVGTALALLCFCFDADGTPRPSNKMPGMPSVVFNKDVIRVRLGRIMTVMPHANPSRATLQSINSFLMDVRD